MKINCLKTLFLLFLTVALSQVSHFAQGQQQLTPHQQELADYIKTNYTKREVSIPMRDGVKLFTQSANTNYSVCTGYFSRRFILLRFGILFNHTDC